MINVLGFSICRRGANMMAGEAHNMDLDSVATDRFAQDRNEAAFYEQAGYRQEAAMRLA